MKFEKLGENKVQITRTKKIKDNKGKEFEVDTDPVEYGLGKLNNERASIQRQIEIYSDPRNITKLIANLQAQLEELDLIEEEINK